MSTVLNFFKEHQSDLDDLHKILKKVSVLEAQLIPIRQKMLGACGAQMDPNTGKVGLVVADLPAWNRFSEEQAAITGKLEAISAMVAELDKIFAEIEAAGIEINRKTPAGIWNAAPRTDPPYQYGEYVNGCGTRVDRNGIQIKSVIDPRFLAWAERAEKAMSGL
jgi:hypothetical protein